MHVNPTGQGVHCISPQRGLATGQLLKPPHWPQGPADATVLLLSSIWRAATPPRAGITRKNASHPGRVIIIVARGLSEVMNIAPAQLHSILVRLNHVHYPPYSALGLNASLMSIGDCTKSVDAEETHVA
jgi:hypothetical protein